MRILARGLLVLLASVAPALLSAFAPAQDAATITPPASAVVEGMPSIPASIAEALGPYGEFRGAVFQGWHPTRREMLITTRFGDVYQVHLVQGPGRARTQLTFLRDGVPEFAAASFPPAGGEYAILRTDATAGGQRFQLSRFDLASRTMTLLTDGRAANSPPVWSRAGTRIAYYSTRRTGRDRDVYVMNPLEPASDRMVLQGQGSWTPLEWSLDDGSLLVMETVSPVEQRLWRVDVASGEKTELAPRGGPPASYSGAQLSGDGRSLYALTDRDSEFRRVGRLDLASNVWTMLTDDRGDVERFEVSPDGRTIAIVRNEDGVSTIGLLDSASGKIRPVSGVPAGMIQTLGWHPSGSTLAFNVRSISSDNDVHSLDHATGRVVRWTFSETGGVDPQSLVQPEVVRWKSFDGLTISGVLYRPPARFTGRRPIMINIHGGPEAQERPRWQGRSNYFLNELGIAVIFPNVRGSTGFGKTFRELDNGAKRADSVKDIGALLDWIAAQPSLDKERVMITGASYGGYVVMASAAAYPDRFRCAFSGFGVANLATEVEGQDPVTRDIRRYEYGDERDPKTRALLLEMSPVTNASRIRMPIMIAHGKNDTRVPVSQAAEMVEAAKKNGTPVWSIVFNDEGHGFRRKENVDFNFYAWIFFVQEFLLK
jgi:dipeptidyl aminopeptidase/acylaminoacyl peptidase